MISHHSAKFSGQRHCITGDTMILVCFMVLQDHVIKGSCEFRGWSHSR